MLQCPKETLIVRLFYNFSNSFLLLFIFFHFAFIFLAKLFDFFGGNSFYQRNQDGYGFDAFSDEEENEYYGAKSMEEENHCMANVNEEEVDDNQDTDIIRNSSSYEQQPLISTSEETSQESLDDNYSEETRYSTPAIESSSEDDEAVEEEDDILARHTHDDSEANENDPTSNLIRRTSCLGPNNNHTHHNPKKYASRQQQPKMDIMSFRQEENFLVLQPRISSVSQGKKLLVQEKEDENEIFGDTFTIGSTSKDSSEWRSSCRDSGTEDPFSSSSRRSCPNWESYTFFQKYDEEILFLDRISLQKLHETESLRSIKLSCPRSISERIVDKVMRRRSKKYSSSSDQLGHNPYSELECAYVAQICLTWEALNWNYKYFQRFRASRRKFDDQGCPAYVAQQFQQFQVLLQRYVENEPYEHGRRPEIYARIRSFTPKLLQVPEYRDDDKIRSEEGQISSRIHSSPFIGIMEESIRTFMNFLKQDKKNKYEILAEFLRRSSNRRDSSALLLLLKKVNKKKKSKLKDEVGRSAAGNKCLCLRKRNYKLKEELEMLMALIDLKVVSRVLRMADLNGEQLHWCENKMSKIRVSSDGKLHRDSSPLFFPAH